MIPLRFVKNMNEDNYRPSTAGDLQSRSSCSLRRSSETDCSASARAAAVAAETAVADEVEDGSTARTADYTSYAGASPLQDTASPSTAAGTAASPTTAAAASAAGAADSNLLRSSSLSLSLRRNESPPPEN